MTVIYDSHVGGRRHGLLQQLVTSITPTQCDSVLLLLLLSATNPVSRESFPCDHLLLIGDQDRQRWVDFSEDLAAAAAATDDDDDDGGLMMMYICL